MGRLALMILALGLVVLATTAGVDTSTGDPGSERSRSDRIRELLDLTRATAISPQIVAGIMEPLKQAVPGVPAEWWARAEKSLDSGSLTELTIPIYDKHLTDAEIDAMLAFYRTPEGQSVLAKLPVVVQESMVVGQQWAMQEVGSIVEQLKKDGFEVPAGM